MTIQLLEYIFSQENRAFGEEIVEPLIASKMALTTRLDHRCDRSLDGKRIEIKGSRVIGKRTLINRFSNKLDRAVPYAEYMFHNFSCNFQHLKLPNFDFLHYAMFFKDCVVVFGVLPAVIGEQMTRYSATQTGGSWPHMDGQFDITEMNLGHHLKNYLVNIMDYHEVQEHLDSLLTR